MSKTGATARQKPSSTTEPTRAGGPSTRSSSNPIEKDDPKTTPADTKDARYFLEFRGLLVPEGQNVTTNMAALCLYQIANMASNTPSPVLLAIRSLALLLEESETGIATQTYHDGFQAELDNFTSEIQQLIADAHEKIDEKIKSIPINATTQPQNHYSSNRESHTQTPGPATTYSQMLTRTQPDVDPKMLARYGIRRRQVMLDGIPIDSDLGQLSSKELTIKINTALQAIQAGDNVRIRAATKLNRGGILIEMDSDIGAAWTKGEGNMEKLCKRLNDKATVRPRLHQLIAKRAPLSAEPEDRQFISEVEEANGLPTGTITAMRWAKPIYRRSPNQISGHVIFTVNNANEANRLLALGLYIANKKVDVEKCKSEPIRCLKCQGYNHFAKECTEKDDICGKCAEVGHRTKDCNSPLNKCVSCKTDDHASYNRNCPTLLRKQEEKDRNNPENCMPFIPTDAPWTWNKSKNPPQVDRGTGPPPTIGNRAESQQARYRQIYSALNEQAQQLPPLPPIDTFTQTTPTASQANRDPINNNTLDEVTWDGVPIAPRTQDPTSGTK